MAERKSKPRRKEPVDQEETRYNWWQLGMFLASAIGVILVMGLVSQFLSNQDGGPDPWLYWAIGGCAALAMLLWFGGWMANRKAA